MLDALRKSETCAFQRSCWAVMQHPQTDLLTHTHTVLLGLYVESVRGLKVETVRVGPESSLHHRVSWPWTDPGTAYNGTLLG